MLVPSSLVTGRARRCRAVTVLLVLSGAACGGGAQADVGAGAHEAPSTASARPVTSTTTTTAGTVRSVRNPPGYVFDATTAPAVIDRGSDYEAIARSLVRFAGWVEAHHPDPALVDRAYAPGSSIARFMKARAREMQRTDRRVVEIDRAPYDFEQVSRLENVVSFAVVEHLERRRLVDLRGRVLDEIGPRTEHYTMLISRFRADAPWRLLVVERKPQTPFEVQLASTAEGSGELDGGTLGVGIESDSGGLDGAGGPVAAASPSLPRLVHYTSTPLPAGGSDGVDGSPICNAGTAAAPVFGWLYDVVAYSRNNTILSEEHVCVPFPDPAADPSVPPPAPVLPPPPTIGDVWRAIALPRPVVGANPVTRGVTGLDTRLWSGGPDAVQVAVAMGGFRITGTARVVEYRFFTDEGYLGATPGPGNESEPGVTHRFSVKGAHSVSVASVWRATVTMTAIGAGPGGAIAVPIDIDTAVLTATVAYPVTEVRSRLVA